MESQDDPSYPVGTSANGQSRTTLSQGSSDADEELAGIKTGGIQMGEESSLEQEQDLKRAGSSVAERCPYDARELLERKDGF